MVPSVVAIRSRGHTQTGHMVSYIQEEAGFVDGGAQRRALLPGFRVRGCRAGDVLPGRLVLTRYEKKEGSVGWHMGLQTVNVRFLCVNEFFNQFYACRKKKEATFMLHFWSLRGSVNKMNKTTPVFLDQVAAGTQLDQPSDIWQTHYPYQADIWAL